MPFPNFVPDVLRTGETAFPVGLRSRFQTSRIYVRSSRKCKALASSWSRQSTRCSFPHKPHKQMDMYAYDDMLQISNTKPFCNICSTSHGMLMSQTIVYECNGQEYDIDHDTQTICQNVARSTVDCSKGDTHTHTLVYIYIYMYTHILV